MGILFIRLWMQLSNNARWIGAEMAGEEYYDAV